ncbi:MAG: urocanate hydratase [Alphaproteobacteria bacterium]
MARTFNITGGTTLRCKGWRQEALLRMLENVLAVGERPDELIVYAALGKAARDWPSHDAIVQALQTMDEDETLIVQSGKPIGLVRTHAAAPLVIMANCNMVGREATPETFYRLEKAGLICWGGLTAGDWQYIGSQGVIQGTYEIFAQIARQHFAGSLKGRTILTAGMGGMGGAQPLAGRMAGAAILTVEVDPERMARRLDSGWLDHATDSLDEALARLSGAARDGAAVSIGLLGNAADVYPAIVERHVTPDIVTDQTSAHDLIYGYVPAGFSLDEVRRMRRDDPDRLMSESRTSIVRHVRAMLTLQDRGAITFDNGNLIRSQAIAGGVANAKDIPVFTEAFLRPLFARAIGPFRWLSLANEPGDIAAIDDAMLEMFGNDPLVTNWVRLARQHIPFQGLPARIAWLGHGARTDLALAVNAMVREGRLAGPIAFTRDHLDAAAMTHPDIMTENMADGSDAIADWPLLDAVLMGASMADLVAIHSGGGGYAGTMTSAGVTVVADGTDAADQRLRLALTNDTALGVMRYADAGYDEARAEAKAKGIRHISLGDAG